MTTNKPPITLRISIPHYGSDKCTVIAERGDLGTMKTFKVDGLWSADQMVGKAVQDALNDLNKLEEHPPKDIQIPEPPKSAPAQKPAATKTPAASKPAPAPVKPKWYTSPDNGEVKRDDKTALNEQGWFGPFDTQAEAEQHIPEWLKPAFGSKKKK